MKLLLIDLKIVLYFIFLFNLYSNSVQADILILLLFKVSLLVSKGYLLLSSGRCGRLLPHFNRQVSYYYLSQYYNQTLAYQNLC